MFAVLEIDEGETSLKGKILDYVRLPNITCEQVESPNAFSFYKIKAKKYRGKIPWREIAEAAGSMKSKMLIPSDISVDLLSGIKEYEPTVFPLRILMNSALKSLRLMRLDPTRVYVTVVDENAFLTQKVYELAFFASTIHVITKCVFEYECLAEKMMEDFGVSLIISVRMEDSVLSSTVIISDRSATIPLVFGGLLFTNEKRRLMNSTVLIGEGLTLPEKYNSLLSDGIDKLSFASALFELCAADELSDICYDKIITYSKF